MNLQCNNCGGQNVLPDGKTSMFCAFCGTSIEKKIPKADSDKPKSKIKKSKIIDERLAFKGRDIDNINEIIDLYSDTELESIVELTLSDNKIQTLKGLSRFSASSINFSNNKLTIIDELPNFYDNTFFSLDFSNNHDLKEFSIDAINALYEITECYHFELILTGCNNFNLESLCKIDFSKIKLTWCFSIYLDANLQLPNSLKGIGFKKELTKDGKSAIWSKDVKAESSNAIEVPKKSSGGFIATAIIGENSQQSFSFLNNFSALNWIHLITPYVLAIIAFALGKKWEYEGTNFGECLGTSCILVIMFSGLKFMDTRKKTGRSFDSQYGKLEEYKTVHGDANVSNYFWKITLFHIIVMILAFKFG